MDTLGYIYSIYTFSIYMEYNAPLVVMEMGSTPMTLIRNGG